MKGVQSSLQNTIFWIKKSRKGNMNGLEQVQICIYLPSKITNSYQNSIHMSKLILFPKRLEFKDAINLCYSKKIIVLYWSQIPTWAMAQKMLICFIPMVT
jgi:hypothetical protein